MHFGCSLDDLPDPDVLRLRELRGGMEYANVLPVSPSNVTSTGAAAAVADPCA